MNKLSLLLLPVFLLAQCTVSKNLTPKSGPSTSGEHRIAFYNVENLFDTVDDPKNTGDDEYLPSSKKNWTPERYQTKLDHLAKVVEGMGFPTLLGMAEIENEAVLKDFCTKTKLKEHDYGIVHFESPDFRGIDVALIYKQKLFELLDAKTIKIKFPEGMIPDKPDYTTRDLLVVEGQLYGKEKLNLVVAHLPSRSEGEQLTEPRRKYVAEQIQKAVDAIFKKDKDANIIVMGDMNDEPSNQSMTQSLRAQAIGAEVMPSKLYNCFAQLQQDGQGSYRFRGDWNMLDQIILSSNLMGQNPKISYAASTIFQAEWMMYKDEKYGLSPSRTFGGDRYFGGYSDHLPIFVELK